MITVSTTDIRRNDIPQLFTLARGASGPSERRRLAVRRLLPRIGHMNARPGSPYPLGATWDGAGVNFALFSENATGVELCLFGPEGHRETERIRLSEQTD